MKQKLAILLCGLMLLEALPIPILAGQIGEQTGLFLEEAEDDRDASFAGDTFPIEDTDRTEENAAQSGDLMENPAEQDGDFTENTVFTDPYENFSAESSGADITSEYSIPDEEDASGDETEDTLFVDPDENASAESSGADITSVYSIPDEEDASGDEIEDTLFADPDENTSTESSGADITSEYSIPDEEGIAGNDMGRDGVDTETDDSLVNPDEEDAILADEKEEELSGEDESALHPDGGEQIQNLVEEEGETVQTPSVNEQSEDYTSGICGETASYRLDGGTLYIEGQGRVEACPWLKIDNYYDKILKLSISPGITSLDLDYAFEGCRELREISLPDSLKYIGYAAFENCTSLTRVDFPEKIVIKYRAFQNCSNLSKITIHSNSMIWSNENLNAFGGTNLHTFGPDSTYDIHLIYHEGDEYDNLSGMDFNTGRYDEDTEHYEGGLTKIVLPEGLKVLAADFGGNANLTMIKFPEGLEEIWDECFSWCESLGTLSLPKSITKIGQRSFIGCGGLRELNFQNLSNLKEIGAYAFEDCIDLVSVNLPESLEILCPGAFRECTQLQEVYLPNQLKEIMEDTFYGCTSLDPDSESFHWPDQLQEIGYRVFGKTTFEEIHIPEGVRELGGWVFEDNINLKKVHIPKTTIAGGGAAFESAPGLTKAGPSGPEEGAYNIILDSELEAIPGSFFANSSLESIRFPDNVSSLGTETFQNCDHLTAISLPASVTSLGQEMFDSCVNLRVVRLPENIQRVEDSVFYGCTSLKQILFRGDAPSYFNENAFKGANLTVYYPKGNDTWTEEVISNDYGGTVTWKEYDANSVDHEKEREIKINHSGTGKATFYLYDENGSPLPEMQFSYVRHGEDYVEEMNSPAIMTDMYGGFQFPTPYLSCDGSKKEVDIFFDQITPLNGEKLSRDFEGGLTIHATVTPMTSVESWTLGLSKSLSMDQKEGFIDGISMGGGNSACIILKTNADMTKDLTLSITLSQETQQEIKNCINLGNGIGAKSLLGWSAVETKGSGTTERSKTYSTTIYNYDSLNKSHRELKKNYLLLIYLICLLDNTSPGFGNPLLRTVIIEKLVEGNYMAFEVSEEEISIKLSCSYCTLKLKSASSLLGSVKLGSAKSTKTFYAGAEKDLYDVDNMKYTSGIKNSEMYSAVTSDLLSLVGGNGYLGGKSMNDLKASVSDDDSVSVSFCNYDSGFVDLVGWNDIYRYHTLKADQETGRKLINNNSLLKQNHSGAPIPALENSYERLINQMMNENITWSDQEKLTRTSSWNPGFSIEPKVSGSNKPIFKFNVGIGISATHGWSTEVSNGTIQQGQVLTEVDSGHTVQTAAKESDRETLDDLLGVNIPDIVKDLTGLYDGCGGNLSSGFSNGSARIKKTGSSWLGYIFRTKKETSQNESAVNAAFSSRKIYYAPAKGAATASAEEAEENSAYTVGEPYEICINDSDGERMEQFDDGVELKISYTDEELQEAGLENGGRIGIYLYDEDDELYRMVESRTDGNTVTGEIYESGTYLLAVSAAPSIRNLRCTLYEEKWKISADIRSFAGIEGISLTMDGEPVSGEEDFSAFYDPATGKFSYENLEEDDVGPGEHEIVLQATDLQGELSEPVSYTFTRNEITLEELSVPEEVVAGDELTIKGKLGLSQNTTAEELDVRLLINKGNGTEKEEILDLGEDGSFSFTTRAPSIKAQWKVSLEVRDVYGSVFQFLNEDENGRQVPWEMSVIREKTIETENGNEFSIDLMSGTVTRIIVRDSILRIPEGINGHAIKKIADRSLIGKNITELVLPDSVTVIGSYAFSGQNDLTKVTMSKNLIRAGDHAFYNCRKLMEIDLPDSVKKIGEEAFGYCINTDDWETSIKVSGFSLTGGENSEAVQQYRRMFYGDEETGQLVTKITLSKTSVSIMKGRTVVLEAVAEPASAKDKTVSWQSSDEKIATVTTDGSVKGIGKGSATITASAKDGSGVTASCVVTVKQPVTKITLSKKAVSLMKGKTVTLKASAAPTTANNKTVSWTSSNKKVATVTSTGIVKGIAKGSATITAAAKDGSGVKATCKVTVKQPVTKITINKVTTTVSKGKTITLRATAVPSNANNKTVKWTTSNKSIATVTAKGVVKGIKKGTVTITATAADGSGKKATCKVTVK